MSPVLERDIIYTADRVVVTDATVVTAIVVERYLSTHHESLTRRDTPLETRVEVVVVALVLVVAITFIVLINLIWSRRVELLLCEEVVALGPALVLIVVGVESIATLQLDGIIITPSIDIVQTSHTHLRLGITVHVVGAESKRGLRLLAEEVEVTVNASIVLSLFV